MSPGRIAVLILIGLAAVYLTGCAAPTTAEDQGRAVDSTTGAGVTSYRAEPVLVPEGSEVGGERIEIVAGKEYDSISFGVDLSCTDGELVRFDFDAAGIRAFEGQATAAAAMVAIRESLTEAERERFRVLEGAVGAALEAFLGTLSPGVCLPSQ